MLLASATTSNSPPACSWDSSGVTMATSGGSTLEMLKPPPPPGRALPVASSAPARLPLGRISRSTSGWYSERRKCEAG